MLPFPKRRGVFSSFLCVFCPSPFFFVSLGFRCSHFHTEDDEALNLRFFFRSPLHVSFVKKLPTESITLTPLCGRRDAKSTLVVRIHTSPRAAKGKERRSRFFLRLLKVQKQNTLFCLLRSQSVFSRSSSSSSTSFEEEVEKKSNGVVGWKELINLATSSSSSSSSTSMRRRDAIIKKALALWVLKDDDDDDGGDDDGRRRTDEIFVENGEPSRR